MENHNYITIKIPKRKKVTFEALAKCYGVLQTFDYSDNSVKATCRIYLRWGIN